MDIHSQLKTLDFLVIGGYVLAVLGLGFWVSFRRKHTDDLFLAGRKLGWANIGLSIWGTNINPSVLIGFCSTGYALGIVGGNYSWLAWPFLMLLAMVFIPHYLNTRVSTMPEFLSRRYGNSCRVFLSWYVIFSTLTIWLGFTLYAGGLLLGQILDWPFWWSVVALTLIATSFTVAGGLEAVVITDAFQSILMIVASIALTAIGIYKVGGVSELWQAVPSEHWQLFQYREDPGFQLNWYSVILGYFVAGIWFWCTDQTIVQRVLGARDIKQGQLGAVFAGFLKILDVLVFLLPGIICRALFELDNPDEAYSVMVTQLMPTGMVGLIVAVLIAALISTIDSGLNSLSTVFTLDIYKKSFRSQATNKEVILTGRIVTILAGAAGAVIAMGLNAAQNRNLFEMGQSIIGFLAPPMAAVFLMGILWKRANRQGALATMVCGFISCTVIGICFLANWPSKDFWPEFPLLSFYLFAALCLFMVIISLFTAPPGREQRLPTLQETYRSHGHSPKSIWGFWAVLAVLMVILYIVFNVMPRL